MTFTKKTITALLLSALFASDFLFAQSRIIFDDETSQEFKLKPALDIPLSIGASGIAISAFIADFGTSHFDWNFKDSSYVADDIQKSDVIIFDQLFMTSYKKPLSTVSTVTAGLLMTSPAVMVFLPNSQSFSEKIFTYGTMYSQTMALAYGIKQWIKLLTPRARPYMYYDNFPRAKLDDGDWNNSFFSGHTTFSFVAASFLTYAFYQEFPDSPYRFLVTALSYSFATTTAILRIASGSHFFSDVLVGALVGTFCGISVPYMHTELFYSKFKKKNNFSVNIGGASVSATLFL